MDINFSRNLIKGKVTEAIFEEMFRTLGKFTILPLGYEHTTPILAQYRHLAHVQKVFNNLSQAPDFALISDDKTQVFLIEVKYRSQFDKEDILNIANKMHLAWSPCLLFVASTEAFYFESVQEIINNKGNIERLADSWIKKEIQDKYLVLINEFIK